MERFGWVWKVLGGFKDVEGFGGVWVFGRVLRYFEGLYRDLRYWRVLGGLVEF